MKKGIYTFWLDWKFNAKITSILLNMTLWSIAALLVTYYVIEAKQTAEQTGNQLLHLGDQTVTRAAERIGESVKVLETLARTPSLVEAVKEANQARAGWTPAAIAAQDNAWADGDPSIESTLETVAQNPVSAYLSNFRRSNPEEAEVFLTDARGLNIAMTRVTSDFLQSDEEWWQAAFAGGYGATYFGPVEYDESSGLYAMDIGVPIKDPETGMAIGVLRGTLSTSVLIDILGETTLGATGDIILVDPRGIVLYSRTPGYFMKPAPDEVLALFQPGQDGWQLGSSLDGDSEILAYGALRGSLGQALGWRFLVTQNVEEATGSMVRGLAVSSAASLFVAVFGVLLCILVVRNSIVMPLGRLTKMAQDLSLGNIADSDDPVTDSLSLRRDEIGEISRAFKRLMAYFQGAASASVSIADRDLRITVTPNSEGDALGLAFAKMVSELRAVVRQVSASAEALAASASQLASAAEQSGQVTGQIAATIQQIAADTAQQASDITRTSASVEQVSRAVEGVARGAQEQARAVSEASQVTSRISSAIEQVAENAQVGAQRASETADAAHSGTRIVEAIVSSMGVIKTKVDQSAQQVRELGRRSDQIDTIVETIDEIASQTNLLALNAAIEAARVESKGEQAIETLLQEHLLGAVGLIADFLASGFALNSGDLKRLARQARVGDFFIADADGVITASSDPGSLGFRFSEDPRQQSSAFRALLRQTDGVVVQPVADRDQDGKPYVYVGISRRDQPGIVQAGAAGDLIRRYGGYSRGFAVVADEVRKLAEHAKTSTKEIAGLIRGIQKTVTGAVRVMEEGARDVENGSTRAVEAGRSLTVILGAAEVVNDQVSGIAAAVQEIRASSDELVRAMTVVSTVVSENTAATREMSASSNKATLSLENIAVVSEANGAAVEEVSASTEEMSAQAKQVSASAASLLRMAAELQRIVVQFKLPAESSPDQVTPPIQAARAK